MLGYNIVDEVAVKGGLTQLYGNGNIAYGLTFDLERKF